MANPRFIDRQEIPSVELLGKLARAKEIYLGNLEVFCEKHGILSKELTLVDSVYLIGSHATIDDWHNETSDVDFKLVVPSALPMDLHKYKREVLDPILCPKDQEKHRWIDLFFVGAEYQVLQPRFDLTNYWNKL